MWTYHQEDLNRRLPLADAEGFLLDYWLFLHADETHPIWGARPLGIQFLGRTAFAASGPKHRALLMVVSRELSSLATVAPLLPIALPAAPPIDPTTNKLSAAWASWLEVALSARFRQQFLSALESGIGDAVVSKDFRYLSFLLRRLSAELADDDTTPHAIISQAKQAILYPLDGSGLLDRLHSALFLRTDQCYLVRFSVTPVPIPSAVALRAMKRNTSVLILSGDSGTSKRLEAIEISVSAHHPTQAIHLAIPSARQILQQLRLRHYIRATFHGPVTVTATTGETPTAFFSLPGPFWSKDKARRGLPVVPGAMNFVLPRLSESDRSRWTAAAWHVASAISQWPEDIHSAASEVWQGLETFAGSRQSVTGRVVDAYLAGLAVDILTVLAKKISHQRRILATQTAETDWRYWDRQRWSLPDWLSSVLNSGSQHYIASWRKPIAPLVLHDAASGLLRVWWPALRSNVPPPWARDRLIRDLEFLYGLRNAAVHAGVRVGNERVASYLGRVGLEVLFSGMAERANDVLARVGTAESVNSLDRDDGSILG